MTSVFLPQYLLGLGKSINIYLCQNNSNYGRQTIVFLN